MQINTKFFPFPTGLPDVYLVGGTVRDILLNTSPKDYDLVAIRDPMALAEQIAQKAESRVIALGKPGLRLYRVVAGQQVFDIAPAKGECIASDLKQRDFTINALAIRLETGEVLDPTGGLEDIHGKKIRMISYENLKQDPLRMLRAYRIGACLNFIIDGPTRDAISREAFRIRESAGERVREELMKLLATPNAFPHLAGMDETGLLLEILPEMAPLKHCGQNRYHDSTVFEHTLRAFKELESLITSPEVVIAGVEPTPELFKSPARLALLKLSLLLHDLGKPEAQSVDEKGNIHFYAHETVGADIASNLNHRLRFSNKDRQYMDFMIRNHLKPLFLFLAHQKNQLTRRGVFRFFLKSGRLSFDLLIHAIADNRGKADAEKTEAFIGFATDLIRSYFQDFLPATADPPVISGHDLIEVFGLSPSPLFAKILEQVRMECLANKVRNRRQAIEIARKLLETASFP